ncbi:hypothetical protein HAX54_039622, partial [Datura stramonium]|nr:hypothetical protein [Datura stramonium]
VKGFPAGGFWLGEGGAGGGVVVFPAMGCVAPVAWLLLLLSWPTVSGGDPVAGFGVGRRER